MTSPITPVDASPFELKASEPVELTPGLTFQWLFGDFAICFTALHASRTLIDTWANKVLEVARDWPAERPFFVLQDFSAKDCASTPYGRAKNKELQKSNTHLKLVAALVMQNNLTMQLSRFFINSMPQRKNKPEIYITFTRNDGLNWLKRKVDAYLASSETEPK